MALLADPPTLQDPSPAELWAMSQGPFSLAVQWVGLPAPALAAIADRVGDLAHARDVVLISSAVWQAGLLAAMVEAADGTSRPLCASELQRAASLRRIARLQVGLPPSEPSVVRHGPAQSKQPRKPSAGCVVMPGRSLGDSNRDAAVMDRDPEVAVCEHCSKAAMPNTSELSSCTDELGAFRDSQSGSCCKPPVLYGTSPEARQIWVERWRGHIARCPPLDRLDPCLRWIGTVCCPIHHAGPERRCERPAQIDHRVVAARKISQKVFCVEIWELQRRTTLFSSSWRAPFLPHDGLKRWRWVDKQYAVHVWTAGTKECSALSDEPPIQAPKGWKQETAGWILADAMGACDNDKWQYAIDFYEKDGLWGRSSLFCHCRRRLWKCLFLQAPRAPKSAGAGTGQGPRPALRPSAEAAPEMTTVLQATLPPRCLGAEAQGLLADDWRGCLLLDVFEAQDFTEVTVGPWLEDDEAPQLRRPAGAKCSKVRTVSLRCPCPASAFAPPSTFTSATFRISTEDVGEDVSVEIDGSWVMHDIPFGDSFSVRDCISLMPSKDGLSVTKTAGLVFNKSTMLQSAIEHATIAGQKEKSPALLSCLRCRADGVQQQRVVEVWELQRRATLLQNTWHAPFLPHDRGVHWRWVDAQYCKHPWISVEQCIAADSDVPPVQPPEGWHRDAGGWLIVDGPGPCDEAWWQYAVDFYINDSRWGDSPSLCHCRRRLWRCTFRK
mmetsp:Transcript_1730/g.5429  ORF Transcript_1730/g.5429 Transcript_1730/m.5429 type:complete len:722 (-) Transcript_1730:291-2456(-)